MSETPVPVPDKGGWIDGETGPVFGGPPPEPPDPPITRTDTQDQGKGKEPPRHANNPDEPPGQANKPPEAEPKAPPKKAS